MNGQWIGALDLASVVPFSILVGVGIVVLFLEVFQRRASSRDYLAYVSAVGFGVAGLAAYVLAGSNGYSTFSGMNYLDGYTQVLTVLYCVAGAFTALIAPGYLAVRGIDRGEFYALLLFATSGMVMMTSAADLVVFFIGLEIMSVAVYALTAYWRGSRASAESGIKYFFLGAFATGLMLYGIALIYGATGTTNLVEIGQMLGNTVDAAGEVQAFMTRTAQDAIVTSIVEPIDNFATPALNSVPYGGGWTAKVPLAFMGMLLILVAFAVKVAAAPFHMWAPDAYTGAPTPLVGFLAAAVKAAGFAALVRALIIAFFDGEMRMGYFGWVQTVVILSLLSMVVGNLVAIVQKNVKRMLAYSSVAHTGYLLVAIAAMGYAGQSGMAAPIVFYLFAYTFGTVGAFGVLSYLGSKGESVETYEDLNGIGKKYPWLGLSMIVFMLSSAGIPPAAGFMGKLMLFRTAVEAGTLGQHTGTSGWELLIALVVVGIIVSVAGVYYYLRVLVHMYMKEPTKEVEEIPNSGAKFAIIACAAFSILFGVLPGNLVDWSNRAIDTMSDRPDAEYVEYVDGEPVAAVEDAVEPEE